MPRPIEMHAHDPRRYLGDMLAWVHQSLASEHELLVGLFGKDAAGGAGSAANPRRSGSADAGAGIDMPKTTALLDRVFESICRPLKVPASLLPCMLCVLGYPLAVEQLRPSSDLCAQASDQNEA